MLELPILVRGHRVATFTTSEEFAKDLSAIAYNGEKPLILSPAILITGGVPEILYFHLVHKPAVSEASIRADFEKWARTKGMNLNTRSDGQYSEYRTGVSWDAWCAKP